jgi:hypothetical protein
MNRIDGRKSSLCTSQVACPESNSEQAVTVPYIRIIPKAEYAVKKVKIQ